MGPNDLGHKAHSSLAGLACVQCGWQWRLGTLYLERVLLQRARLQLLPVDHPAAVIFRIAQHSTADTWALKSARYLNHPGYEQPIRELMQCDWITADCQREAQADKTARKRILTSYRDLELRPVLSSYDSHEVESSSVDVCGLSFEELQPMGTAQADVA